MGLLAGQPGEPGNTPPALDKRPFMGYIIAMRTIMRLLGAKYMLNGRYYWRLSTAIAKANDSMSREIVWTIKYKKAYDNRMGALSVHPDANNFYTKW